MNRRRVSRLTKQLPALIILIQLCWCPAAWGLDPDQTCAHYLVDQWTIDDGMPSNTILCAAQTPDGYLWVATTRGLVRFDGIKFSDISFPGKDKNDSPETAFPDTLFVDKGGRLWIGRKGRLTLYDYKKRQFKTFTNVDGLPNDRIRRINEDMKGNLWLSFFAGYVSRFSEGKFTSFDAAQGLGGKKFNAIIEDQKGNLLFASRENGLFKYMAGTFFKYPVEGLDGLLIITMYEDRKEKLWIGTNNGLFMVDGQNVEKYTTRDGLSHDFITVICEDNKDNLWIGTQEGLNRVKRNQNDAVIFEPLLKTFLITYVFEDIESNLWVGTYNSGIKRLKDRKFNSYAPLEAHPGEFLLSLFEDRQGYTWIGTLNGKLYRCRGSAINEIIEPPQLSGKGIAAIAEDVDGNLWLGTNGKGIFQRKKATFNHFTNRDGLADNTVTSIYRDSRGDLWFSTSAGVSVYRYPDGPIESFGSKDGLLGRVVHNVYEDKAGDIWAAADKGITVLKKGKLTKQDAVYHLRDVSVTCIYEDPAAPDSEDRVYWIATHGAGLKRLRLKDGQVIPYTTGDGMASNSIFQFLEDQRYNFWLMSDSGILRISKIELNHFADGKLDLINYISFGISDGLNSPEFNNRLSRHSILKAGSGEFLFITRKGISMVNPQKIPINKTPPLVVIEQVIVNRQSISPCLEPGAYTFKGIKTIGFHFTAPTFLSPGKVKFKYRLKGLEEKWELLPTGGKRTAEYHNLPPGGYTFRVTACNSDGLWNKSGAFLTFTIEPFFYQTLLFKIAVLLLFAALLYAAYYIYKKRSSKEKANLEEAGKREEEREEGKKDGNIKYKDSNLNPIFADECIKKLRHLMVVEKVYCDEKVSLKSLAKKLSISSHQLSRLVNEKLDRNFSDFINYHRIEEVKRILEKSNDEEETITDVAHDVGFNSMAAFYKAFKKYTHMKPKQYKEEIRAKNKTKETTRS